MGPLNLQLKTKEDMEVGVWDLKGKNGSSQEEGKTKVW